MDSKLKEQATPEQHALLDAVRNSAQQIWQAGLGAFAKAQQGSSDMFDKLVQDGDELHRLTQFLPGGAALADKVSHLAGSVSKQASGSWDKLETIFEERVARAIRSLGVPSQADFDALRADVEALAAAIEGATPARKTARKAAPGPAAKAAVTAAPKRAATGVRKSPAKAVKKTASKARRTRAATSSH